MRPHTQKRLHPRPHFQGGSSLPFLSTPPAPSAHRPRADPSTPITRGPCKPQTPKAHSSGRSASGHLCGCLSPSNTVSASMPVLPWGAHARSPGNPAKAPNAPSAARPPLSTSQERTSPKETPSLCVPCLLPPSSQSSPVVSTAHSTLQSRCGHSGPRCLLLPLLRLCLVSHVPGPSDFQASSP